MSDAVEQDHKKQLREINAALDSGMFVRARNMLQSMAPVDVAFVLEATPPKDRTILWQLVDTDFHGEILEELSDDVRNGIIRQMMPDKVAAATETMDDDDLADVLRSLPNTVYHEVLDKLDHQDRQRAERALSWEEDTAGSIMNTDTITLRPDVTIDVILRYLRLKGELPEATDYLFVVDNEDMLIGKISLADIITSPQSATVQDRMSTTIEAIPVEMDEVAVAQLFERHNWISAPVTDEKGHLLGRITIDDVVDIIREEAGHSMMSMAGLADEEDTFAPAIKSARKRSIWLGINLCTALLAVFVSSLFESTLDQLAILAVLNSVVPSMGGVAGGQTLTLVIRGLALGHINSSNSRWLLGKELAVGILNGMLWAVLIATFVAVWKSDFTLGLIIAFAMLMNLIAAGISGVTIPLILRRLNIDPALAGGVILTTITDIVGIFAFLGTATIFLIK